MILACLVKDVLFGDPCKKYPTAAPVNPKDFEDEDDAAVEVGKKSSGYRLTTPCPFFLSVLGEASSR